MLYQKCSNCKSEWNGIKFLEICPFCNAKIQIEIKNFKSIKDALAYLFLIYGLNIIFEKSKLVSLLADFAPSLEDERRLIRIALNSGVYSDLLKVDNCDNTAQRIAKNKAVNYLNKKEFLDLVWAEKVVTWFIVQLNWTSVPAHHLILSSLDKIYRETIIDTKSNSNFISDLNEQQIIIGDIIYFGQYPYEEDGTLKKIEWEVLDIKEEKILLWSTMCINSYNYHHLRSVFTWESCDLRIWLRDYFVSTAFKNEERLTLIKNQVEPSCNPKFKKNSGPDTCDAVFILSNEQIEYYQIQEEQLISKATPYAKKQGIYCDDDWTASWWLRTPGYGFFSEMFVDRKGHRDEMGGYVDQKNRGIRPAVWVDLRTNSFITKKY